MSKTTTNNIQLNISEKQEYTINGNKENIIKLNPNDMGIIARTNAVVPKLNEAEKKYADLMIAMAESGKDDDEFDIETFSEGFTKIDAELRETVNFLFDYDVCSVIAKDGSMYDLLDGEYRYVVVVETLIELYTETIAEETKKRFEKMKRHTAKYEPQDRKKKISKGTK